MSVQRTIYFPSSGAPAVSPAFDAGWYDTSSADRVAAIWDTTGTSGFATKTVVPASYPAGAGYHSVLIRQYVTPPFIDSWTAATAFKVGQIVYDPSLHVQVVTVAGTSGGSAPAWVHGTGATTTDGTVTWADQGISAYSSLSSFAGSCIARLAATFSPSAGNFMSFAGCLKLYDGTNTLKFRLSTSTLPTSGTLTSTLTSNIETIQVGASGPKSIAAGDYFVIEMGFSLHQGGTPITSASVDLETGNSAAYKLLSSGDTTQGNPWETVTLYTTAGTTPTPPVIPGAWLITNEPGTGYVDQTARLDSSDGSDNSFELQLRQRGSASISLRVAAGDSYAPTLGMQVFLFDVTPTSTGTIVFAGTIGTIEQEWDGIAGYRRYRCNAVSFEQAFDTVRIPPQAFLNSSAGYIISTLFTQLMTGAPVGLGSIAAGQTIPSLVIDKWPTLAEIFDQLATASGYTWGVDPTTLTLYFYAPTTTPGPFTLATAQIQNGSSHWKNDRTDYRNRQILQISGDAFANSSELFAGTGSASTFTLRNPPSEVKYAWVTKNTQNTATGTFTGLPSDGDTITISYPVSGSTYNWAAVAPYALNQIIIDSNLHIQRCTTAGTSGGVQPTWNTSGSTTADGSVVWTDQGQNGGGSFSAAVYTFKTAIDNSQWGQVLIGASAAACALNLSYAINATQAQTGVKFSLPTWENPLVNADTPGGATITIRNKSAGKGYIASLAKAASNFTWSAVTTSGGSTASSGNTITLTVAVEGTSNSANLYYTPGSASVKLASVPGQSVPISAAWSLQVEYTRLAADCISVEDTSLVTSRAAIEAGTGKYQQLTDDTNQKNAATGLLEAQQALAAYKVLPVVFTFETMIPGLIPGQYLTVNFSDNPVGIAALVNTSYLVQEVRGEMLHVSPYMEQLSAPGGGHYRYSVTLINSSVIGSYLDFWEKLGGGAGSSGAGASLISAPGSLSGVASTSGVTSVDFTAPTQFSVGGTPITTSGTIALSWNTQTANFVLAGPSTGAPSAPTFRALVAADVPAVAASAITGIVGISQGGTGQSSAAAAFSALISGSTVAIANGGTNATTAANARTNLGLGTAATFAEAHFCVAANNLSDVTNAATVATNLGLGAGSAVTHASVQNNLGNWIIRSSGNADFANTSVNNLTIGGSVTGGGFGTAAFQPSSAFVASGTNFTIFGNSFNDSLGFPCTGSQSVTL